MDSAELVKQPSDVTECPYKADNSAFKPSQSKPVVCWSFVSYKFDSLFSIFARFRLGINVGNKMMSNSQRNIDNLMYKQRDNKKFELMLTSHAKAYSSSCSQTISLSPAISSSMLIWLKSSSLVLLRGYRSLMPSCAGLLEPRKLRLTFNAENFIRSLSLSISVDFGTILFWNVSRSQKSAKNP